MNPNNFLPVYAYFGAILLCLAVIVLTGRGLRDSERRVFPDVTLGRELERRAVSAGSEARIQMPDQHRVGTAVVINTDYVIPSRAKVTKDLIVTGRVTIDDGARLNGSVKASGPITLGSDVLIEGNLVSNSDISVGPRTEVLGVLHAKENICLMSSSSVSLSVVSRGTVYIHEGARVGKRISAGGGIEYLTSHILQKTAEVDSSFAPTSNQFFYPVCHICRGPLSILDPCTKQQRCLICGSYQMSPNNLSPPFRNPH